MIIVTVQLLSAATGKIETLGVTHICNDATGTHKKRNYDVRVGRKTDAVSGDHEAIQNKPLRTGRVENYNAPAYNVWRLVSRALRSAFPEEK